MHRKKTEELIQKLALKYNLPAYRVKEIVKSEFEFLRHVIMSSVLHEGKVESVMLMGLGKFYAKPGRIYKTKQQALIGYNKKLQQNDTNGHEVL